MADRCPHCGSKLFEDEDGLGCFCGFHQDIGNIPIKNPSVDYYDRHVSKHDPVGWWVALGTRPEVVIGKARELSSAMLNNGATPAELFVAVELVRLRLAAEFHLELSPDQQKNLRGYLTHVLSTS